MGITKENLATSMNITVERLDKLLETNREDLRFCVYYGIFEEDVRINKDNTELIYYISIPAKSFRILDNNAPAVGKELAELFKQKKFESSRNFEECQDLDIVVKYRERDTDWTEELYNDMINTLEEKIKMNDLYPLIKEDR